MENYAFIKESTGIFWIKQEEVGRGCSILKRYPVSRETYLADPSCEKFGT
jgi:hypothetical protein